MHNQWRWLATGLVILLAGCQAAAPTTTSTPQPTPTMTQTSLPSATPTVDFLTLLNITATPVIPIDMAGASTAQIRYLPFAVPYTYPGMIAPIPISFSLSGIDVASQDMIFVFGSLNYNAAETHFPFLLRTDDGGKHWQEIDLPEPSFNMSVYLATFIGGGKGWLITCGDVEDYSCGHLYRTTDFGRTWGKPITIGEWGFHPLGIHFSDSRQGQIVFDKFTASPSDRFGIVSTQDGGQTWKETFKIPHPLKELDQPQMDALRQQYGKSPGGSWGNYWLAQPLWSLPPSIFEGAEWSAFGQGDDAYIIAYRDAPDEMWKAVTILNRKIDPSLIPTVTPVP